jgi:CRP-like cAMP-binding protein
MNFSSSTPLQSWFEKLASRSTLGPPEREAILALPGQSVQVECNRDFVRLGERVDHASLVVSGLLGRFGQNADGGRQVTAVHIPGDMADLHSVVAPDATSALQALSGTTILKVPHSALREAARRYPALAEAFWRECVVDAAVLAEWVVNVGRRDARTRAAHLLCEMACRYRAMGEDNGVSFGFPATQTHMADMMALTPVHVNRTLKTLREEGLAQVQSRAVRILDWNGIVEVGEFDPNYLQVSTPENDNGPRPRARTAAVA